MCFHLWNESESLPLNPFVDLWRFHFSFNNIWRWCKYHIVLSWNGCSNLQNSAHESRLSEEGVIRRVLLFIRGLCKINLFILKRSWVTNVWLTEPEQMEMTTGCRSWANSVISLNERRNVRCQFIMLEIRRGVVRAIHAIIGVIREKHDVDSCDTPLAAECEQGLIPQRFGCCRQCGWSLNNVASLSCCGIKFNFIISHWAVAMTTHNASLVKIYSTLFFWAVIFSYFWDSKCIVW